MKQSGEKIRHGAVPFLAMPRVAQIAVRSLQASAQITNHDDGPLVRFGMVLVGGVGEVDDQGIVHHRAFAFGYRFQLPHKGRKLFAMPPAGSDV